MGSFTTVGLGQPGLPSRRTPRLHTTPRLLHSYPRSPVLSITQGPTIWAPGLLGLSVFPRFVNESMPYQQRLGELEAQLSHQEWPDGKLFHPACIFRIFGHQMEQKMTDYMETWSIQEFGRLQVEKNPVYIPVLNYRPVFFATCLPSAFGRPRNVVQYSPIVC